MVRMRMGMVGEVVMMVHVRYGAGELRLLLLLLLLLRRWVRYEPLNACSEGVSVDS